MRTVGHGRTIRRGGSACRMGLTDGRQSPSEALSGGPRAGLRRSIRPWLGKSRVEQESGLMRPRITVARPVHDRGRASSQGSLEPGYEEVSPDRRFGLRSRRGVHGLREPAGHRRRRSPGPRPTACSACSATCSNTVERQYVTEVDDTKLIEAAIDGMLTSLDPALRLPRPRQLRRHARPDPRRVRRPGHRGHQRRRRGQGDLADGRHPGLQGRHQGRRLHHRRERRERAGPVGQRGRQADARHARARRSP